MSNCLDIHTGSFIPWQQITEPQMLLAHLKAAAADPTAMTMHSTNWRNYHFAWFMRLNENVFIEPDGLMISWGLAKSMHTWRDFRSTLRALSGYLVPDVHVVVEASDESDGFDRTFQLDYDCAHPGE